MDYDLRGYDALVMADASEHNADMYYATRFRAPDAFVFVQLVGQSLLMTSDLELGRARSQSSVDRVVTASRYERELKQSGMERPRADDVLLALLRDVEATRILVPGDFAVSKADFLRAAGMEVTAAAAPLFPQRQIKTDAEVEAVHEAMQAAERSMEVAIDAVGQAEVVDGVLQGEGQPLTSERVRRLIHLALMEQDFTASHTIVAGGDQGCDPHQIGTGPLRAGQTIVIDIFPQSMETGYFGDITRTVVKGKASESIQRVFAAVHSAQETALERISAGVDGARLHREVQQLFADAGYETGEMDGQMQGFFHGTGHGVGLAVHETPRIGLRGDVLQAGQVVTVEPGLYYPGVGGVRLEDTVVVRPEGCDNLTTFPKFLEI